MKLLSLARYRSAHTLCLYVVFLCAAVPPMVLAQISTTSDLAALSADQVSKLLADPGARYALVTRPSDRDYNRVELLTLDATTLRPLTRTPTALGCARVHAANAGNVYCFTRVQHGKPKFYTGPKGYLFDRQLNSLGTDTERKGTISRARLSSDGRYFANTAFTTGHSYLGVGGTSFSTATFIGTAATPRADQNLQLWSITHNGKAVSSVDLNLWGVSFDPTNSDRFMVTTYFDGKPHLAEGSVQGRSIKVLRVGVECPSFSPDGQRIAFKKRVSATRWSPAILELSTQKETVFDIDDSVDDQVEWLDNKKLIFEMAHAPMIGAASVNLYTLDSAQNSAKPILWLADARSPTFVRR